MSRLLELDDDEKREFLQIACAYASRSPDPSTQNGAVLVDFIMQPRLHTITPKVVAHGYNTFPLGVKYGDSYPDRYERPKKYAYIEHAERSAIYRAAREGVGTKGLILVCPWAACSDCARGIIEAGIREVVTLTPIADDTNARWDSSINAAMEMLEEAKVTVTYFESPIFREKDPSLTLRRNGILWHP